MRILVVEDEDRIASFLKKGLSASGYAVVRAATGAEALEATEDGGLDLAILDLGLPDEDGLSILERWRTGGLEMPVIILTARDGIDDRVQGLNLGADDYLPKPFAFDELLARVRARLRPRNGGPTTVLQVGRIRLDLLTRRATVDDRSIDLTTREFALLECLLRHPGRVMSRDQLLDQAWPFGVAVTLNAVDAYVHYLREKLGPAADRIETVRGVGYRMRAP